MSIKPILSVLFITSICACSSNSLEDYKEEGEGITRSIIKEIQFIQSREELIVKTPRLKKLFHKLVEVIMAAQEFRDKHPGDSFALSNEGHQLSDALRAELIRLFSIEGARDIFEKTQQDSLYRLDAFLQKREKGG